MKLNFGVWLQKPCSSMLEATKKEHVPCMKEQLRNMHKHCGSTRVFDDVSEALKYAGMENNTKTFSLLLGWCCLCSMWLC
jgi:hypothetical protein